VKKFIFLGIVIIVSLLLIAGFIYTSLRPDKLTQKQKEEAVEQIMGRKANLNPQIKTGSTHFEGKYATFKYPAAAKIYEYRSDNFKNNKAIVESFSFDLAAPKRVFNYTVATQGTGLNSLDEVPAIKLRLDSSRGYTKEEIKVGGEKGLSFKKDRSGEYQAEKTTFILKDGKLYTFSITGSSLIDAEKLSDQVLSSVVFSD
jgi:hypothetical protein